MTVTGEALCETALNRSLDQGTILRQLSKTGGTPFLPSKIDIDLGEDTSMPLSALNQMRREATDRLAQLKAGRQAHTKLQNAQISDCLHAALEPKSP